MTHRIRFTLVAVLLLGVGSLVLGGFGAVKSTPRGHSPYLSAMSDLAVPPAAAKPCNQMVCIWIDRPGGQHDHWGCTDSGGGTHCLVQDGGSTCRDIIPCPQ